MKLIKPNQISGEILTLIEEADEKVILISPYCKFQKWYKLKEKIISLEARKVDLEFYVRAGEENTETFKELHAIGVKPIEINKLHCKIYMNEKYAVVSSMNLLLYSEINSLEIAYKTENKEEYDELMEFVNRYIRVRESKKTSDLKYKVKHQITLKDLLAQNKISVFEKDDQLAIRTSRNNYTAFIFNEFFNKNHLRMNGIVSEKELEYAKKTLAELEENTKLKIECVEGSEEYYSMIWGTSISHIESRNILELQPQEVEEVGKGILRFIEEVEQLKEFVCNERRKQN